MSVIVTVPLGLVFETVPEVTLPLTVKSSFGSSMLSSIIGIVTSTLVCPAGIVTVMLVLV